ncbi:MAG: RDD family protein [Acidobacteriia bacterium]|nr:RDD family protein [Terriglobia bacterium]
MICNHCGSRNVVGARRCHKCGRTPDDTLSAGFDAHRTDGALAAQPMPAARVTTAAPQVSLRVAPNYPRATQGSLFPERSAANVIPMPASPARAPRRPARPPADQGKLDFLPGQQARPRTLRTTVEAVIYCEDPVATTLHRAVAAALDAVMVLIGYGLFLLVFRLCGGEVVLNKTNLLMFGGALLVMGFTYGLFWALANTETAGMRWTHLRLTTFDGFPPDGRQRLLRFFGSTLSLCTLVGLLWSLADEESLTWQDHISGTFPTPRELESQVFRRR